MTRKQAIGADQLVEQMTAEADQLDEQAAINDKAAAFAAAVRAAYAKRRHAAQLRAQAAEIAAAE